MPKGVLFIEYNIMNPIFKFHRKKTGDEKGGRKESMAAGLMIFKVNRHSEKRS